MVLNSCAFLGKHEEAKRQKQMDRAPGKNIVPTRWCQPMVEWKFSSQGNIRGNEVI